MSALGRLAQAHGIALRYHDIFGVQHEVADATLRALLAAMGVDASSDASADAAMSAFAHGRWSTALPPLVVLGHGATPWRIRVRLPATIDAAALRMQVAVERGKTVERPPAATQRIEDAIIDGEPRIATDLTLVLSLPIGYHGLTLLRGDEAIAHTRLAVTPGTCYRPPALRRGGRSFGAAVQLYGLRSRRNWGIGDFTDLADLVERVAALGAGIVGVNPLHALFPHQPRHASPYSPSSRLFANPLYLDIEAIDDFAECEAARERVAAAAFQERLAALRAAPLVDYAGVAAAKREILELLFASFRARHMARRSARARRFQAFRRDGGTALQRQALYDALQAHFSAHARWGFPAWPSRFRDPDSTAVAAFAREHADRVAFYAYLQWQADVQRGALAARARKAGLAVGLYADLAVSIDRAGAEVWANQSLYATGASVGAPPDAFNLDGQDWGLPPMIPSRLVDAGYAPFIATLRANMRHAGALRIDHVMALMRLFWIPSGGRAAEGSYVSYPFDDLVALVALESHRHRAMVIGEDLGTVPDEVRETLARHDVLSYRVLLFERDGEGAFKPPGAYPEAALATASTHDLPTLAGWWEAHDIDARERAGLVASDAERDRQRSEREDSRRRLLQALASAGALPPDASADPNAWPAMTPALAAAIQAFLAMAPCVLDVVQLEDALLVGEQANLPGTVDQHPNWRRKLPVDLEAAFDDASLVSMLKRVSVARDRAAR